MDAPVKDNEPSLSRKLMNQKEKFRELLRDFSTAVLITHTGKNDFRARPMAIAAVDEECGLWFITHLDSAKVHEIERNTHVHVVCQNSWASCISITGRATLNFDRSIIYKLWNPAYLAWFPKGVNDPDITLIHVVGEQGEYWDNSGLNRISYIYQTIKAIVTGTTPEVVEGDQHGQVKLAKPLKA